jgi:ketosteroid isomerase-like protein
MAVIRNRLLIVAISLIAGPYATLHELAAQDIPKWLEDREAAWVKAYNAGNGRALAQMWVDDGVLLLHSDVVRGRPAIEQRARRKNSCSFPIKGAHVLDQLAAVWGKSHCPGGNGAAPVKGEWMRVYERQPDGSWLIARDTGQ